MAFSRQKCCSRLNQVKLGFLALCRHYLRRHLPARGQLAKRVYCRSRERCIRPVKTHCQGLVAVHPRTGSRSTRNARQKAPDNAAMAQVMAQKESSKRRDCTAADYVGMAGLSCPLCYRATAGAAAIPAPSPTLLAWFATNLCVRQQKAPPEESDGAC